MALNCSTLFSINFNQIILALTTEPETFAIISQGSLKWTTFIFS
jgi:hypothetical protein